MMQNEDDQHFCVLARNTVGYKFCDDSDQQSKQRVLRLGSMAKILNVREVLPVDSMAVLDTSDNSTWLINKVNVLPLIPSLVQAFEAITSYSVRVALAKNESLCKELAKIKCGTKVYLCPEEMILKQNAENWEEAIVRYIGPIPELGSASHFYGLALGPGSTQGDVDGSYCNRRYFYCPTGCRGIFVSINRLRPYPWDTVTSGGDSLQIPDFSMQSNGNNNEQAKTNYKTTLHLQLKDKKNIPRTESFGVGETTHMSKIPFLSSERCEKLIDVDSEECPLVKGDRVVWVSDETGPEVGTVCWMGFLQDSRITDYKIGVEFDRRVGSGTGTFKGTKYFQSKMNHASFLPIHALMKAEDFFGHTEDYDQSKLKKTKSFDNFPDRASEQSSIFTSKSDAASKSRVTDQPLWSRAVVQLPEYTEKHSSVRDLQGGVDIHKSNCQSQYDFPEIPPNINTLKGKLKGKENVNVRGLKDSKRSESTLESYPIGEAFVKDYLLAENIAEHRKPRTAGDSVTSRSRPTEVKIRHSYSKDGNVRNSVDTTDFLGEPWCSSNIVSTLEKQKTSSGQLNNNDFAGLEIVGLKMQNIAGSSKANDHEIQLSPNVSDCSNGSDIVFNPSTESHDLGVGSVVEVSCKGEPRYGVIRWIGTVPEDSKCRLIAGIEMEEEIGCSDGTFYSRRYFHCNPKKALFVRLGQCKKDGRFQESLIHTSDNRSKLFGPEECPVIPGAVRPCTVSKQEDMDMVCGKYKGIQGHHNSCYLDATLFSMFAFTSAFDNLLFRPRGLNDTDKYEEVQRVLREEIVNPLRKNQFCRWDRVMKLRTLLENHSSVTGLTSEEKDPEEFLTSLVAQMLRAKPFLKLSSGQEAYHYQLFVDKDEHLRSPTVQQLFEQSFLSSDIKLKEVPSCLIIQMPRFGKSYKMYPRIFPSPLLDVTDIIEDSPRQCTVCGKLAQYECRECFGKNGIESNTLESISFCTACRDTVHSHKLRSAHKFRELTVPKEFAIMQDHCQIPRIYMHLFAVVCIETSHYVSFVKCGTQPDSPWCFFDSMADRKGEQNGYNIPEVVACPDIPYWLSEDGVRVLSDFKDDRKLPEHAKRLLCDAYMCMYQSTDMIMYK